MARYYRIVKVIYPDLQELYQVEKKNWLGFWCDAGDIDSYDTDVFNKYEDAEEYIFTKMRSYKKTVIKVYDKGGFENGDVG